MAGVNATLVNVRGQGEVSGWVRASPWTYVDLTVGGTVLVPWTDAMGGGLLAELRFHVPLNEDFRLVLLGSDEFINRRFNGFTVSEGVDRAWSHKVSGGVALAYTTDSFEFYAQPKFTWFQNLLREKPVSTGLFNPTFLRFSDQGTSSHVATLLIGAETTIDGLTLGASTEAGVLRTTTIDSGPGSDPQEWDPVLALSLYVGFSLFGG